MQEGSSEPSEGLRFSLASKFTSENPPGAKAGDALVQVVGGVDPASRPAGLTLRTSATTDTSKKSSSVPALESNSGAAVGKNPVRRTVDWTPAPLLCKRLNVPVPKASSAADWAMKGGGAAAPAEHEVLASLRKFVSESSASSLPKVRFRLFFTEDHDFVFYCGWRDTTSLSSLILFSLFLGTLALGALPRRYITI